MKSHHIFCICARTRTQLSARNQLRVTPKEKKKKKKKKNKKNKKSPSNFLQRVMTAFKAIAAALRPSALDLPTSKLALLMQLASSSAQKQSGEQAKVRLDLDLDHGTVACRSTTKRPLPQTPLPWTWQCHHCGRVYSLGVTRRCLEDGHVFCVGNASRQQQDGVVRKIKRVQRRSKRCGSCASEFDYNGWKRWGEWRAKELDRRRCEAHRRHHHMKTMPRVDHIRENVALASTNQGSKRDCSTQCNFPSECRRERWLKALSDEALIQAYETKIDGAHGVLEEILRRKAVLESVPDRDEGSDFQAATEAWVQQQTTNLPAECWEPFTGSADTDVSEMNGERES